MLKEEYLQSAEEKGNPEILQTTKLLFKQADTMLEI